jgi:poly-gamma-glutamate capsule biosynthesis protein CapA/YwtB (metallophosphatase superfamily)
MTIGLLGDVMLGRQVARALGELPPERVWSDELAELCRSCDALICNLECCISERGSRTRRIRRKPFFFRAPPSAIESLAAVGASAVSLANNHALDYEEEALADTFDYLSEAGIASAGAGLDREEARKGAVFEVGAAEEGGRRLKVGLLAVTDHPADYAAGAGSPGVAWADLRRGLPDWVASELERLRAGADLVVFFPHWGPNMTTSPDRWQIKRAREVIGAGADLVAGHSAHVFHGIERIDGRPVLYDLGDALDDYRIDRELRNDLGILALWSPGSEPDLELVGLGLDYCETDLARGKDADWIADRLEEACGAFGTPVERVGEQRFVVGGKGR